MTENQTSNKGGPGSFELKLEAHFNFILKSKNKNDLAAEEPPWQSDVPGFTSLHS